MKPLYIESPESEARYRELSALGVLNKIPVPEMFIELKVMMPGQEKPLAWWKRRSHSWVRNAYNIHACDLMGIRHNGGFVDGGTSIKNYAGAVQTASKLPILASTNYSDTDYTRSPETVGYGYYAGVGDTTLGILIGVGLAAESFEDFAMSSLCAEGTGLNQLHYVAQTFTRGWDAETRKFSVLLSRYLNNNGAGIIDVTEVGLVARGTCNASWNYMMMARDTFAAISVPPSGQILATYTLSVTLPS